MLGNLSIGILFRDPTNLQFDCGNCGQASPLLASDLPAAIKMTEAATCHVCPKCGVTSKASQIIQIEPDDLVEEST